MYLTVYVRNVHNIFVNQDDTANAGSGQRLRGDAADAADAQHGDGAALHLFQTFRADGKLCA
ncbi:hypothetical protein D3C78_1761940 [compost metagenome]